MVEHKLLYGSKGARAESGAVDATRAIPLEDYLVPLDTAAVCRMGKDVTILGWLLMLHHALDAARHLEPEGIDAEVIDVRSLSPLDYDTIGASVEKTGPGGDRRGRPEDRLGQRGDRGRDPGALWGTLAMPDPPRGLGRRAGAVHSRAGKRLPPRCAARDPGRARGHAILTPGANG